MEVSQVRDGGTRTMGDGWKSRQRGERSGGVSFLLVNESKCFPLKCDEEFVIDVFFFLFSILRFSFYLFC